MKKIIALVVALVMMAAMAVPAFAAGSYAGGQGEQQNQTVVKYGTQEAYVVTVPAQILLETKEVEEGDLKGQYVGTAPLSVAAGYKIAAGKKIQIKITAATQPEADKWYLDNLGSETNNLEYTIHKDAKTNAAKIARGANAVALEANADVTTSQVLVNLYFATVGTDMANEFEDLLTFNAAVVAQ